MLVISVMKTAGNGCACLKKLVSMKTLHRDSVVIMNSLNYEMYKCFLSSTHQQQYGLFNAFVRLVMISELWLIQICVASSEYSSKASWINCCCRTPNDHYNLYDRNKSDPKVNTKRSSKVQPASTESNAQVEIY